MQDFQRICPMVFPIPCSGKSLLRNGTDLQSTSSMQETTVQKTEQKIAAEKACHFFPKAWVLIAEQPLMDCREMAR
jgi:hypothetical protein